MLYNNIFCKREGAYKSIGNLAGLGEYGSRPASYRERIAIHGAKLDIHVAWCRDDASNRHLRKEGREYMTKKELAEKLNGTEYAGFRIFSEEILREAKESGLVIVYGASEDLMEFEGAFTDEGGCFCGGTVYFDLNGVSQDEEEKRYSIYAKWCKDVDEEGNPATWSYETDIPHETFKIWEDGDLFCIGLVFSIEDIQ